MRDNIVGTVMVLSLVIWIPLVWVFHRIVSRRRLKPYNVSALKYSFYIKVSLTPVFV